MRAEFGQGLRAVLVQEREHIQRRVSETTFWPLAAEPTVELPHRRSHSVAKPSLAQRVEALVGCIRPHKPLVYLIEYL